MEVESNVKADMKKLGCTSAQKINLAYHLYIFLIDIKLMYDVNYRYNNEIDTLYIVAKPGKKIKPNIYIPFPTTEDVTISLIEILQEKLCTDETGFSVNLAFIEGDLTTVLYHFTKGLIASEAPEGLTQRKNRYDRHKKNDEWLKQNREKLIEDALAADVMKENEES